MKGFFKHFFNGDKCHPAWNATAIMIWPIFAYKLRMDPDLWWVQMFCGVLVTINIEKFFVKMVNLGKNENSVD